MTKEEVMRLTYGDYVEYCTEQNGENTWWNIGKVSHLLIYVEKVAMADTLIDAPYRSIRPIKTTPELLVKNGFVSEQVGLYKTIWTKECITIEQTVSSFLMPCGLNEDIDVSEVHRLQQVIRLINGKELIV